MNVMTLRAATTIDVGHPVFAPRGSWICMPGSQAYFLSSPVHETLYEGTRGPGKTDALLMAFVQFVGLGYGAYWNGIIFRETYKQLDDLIKKSKRWFHTFFPSASYNKGEYSWEFLTGETLALRHMASEDDYNNYHGHEYPFIGWEELTRWGTLKCYDLMKSTCRSSAPREWNMPRMIRATTNPYGRGHNAVKRRFIDPAPRGTIIVDELSERGRVAIHGDITENLVLMLTDPDYIKGLDAIEDPNLRKAWRFGSWDISSGGMFDDLWDANVHVLEPFAIPDAWVITRSFDWGSSAPFSVGWWAHSDGSPVTYQGQVRHFARGSMVRVGEWYGADTKKANVGINMMSDKIAVGIKQREERLFPGRIITPGAADASIYDVRDGQSIGNIMAKHGAHFIPAAKGKGSRAIGWDHLRRMLSNARDNEDAGLYTLRTCRDFIRLFPTLPRNQDDLDDVDTTSEDHIGDETRYEATRNNIGVSQRQMFGRGR